MGCRVLKFGVAAGLESWIPQTCVSGSPHPASTRATGLQQRLFPMVSLGIIVYFCSYRTQENIKNGIFMMVLRGYSFMEPFGVQWRHVVSGS